MITFDPITLNFSNYQCSILIFYCNKPHTYTYSCTNRVHIQRCTSFNIVRHPEASPCTIKSAGSPFSSSSQPATFKSVQCSKITGINKM